MGVVVRGGRAKRRASGSSLVVGVSVLCLVLTVAPGAAAAAASPRAHVFQAATPVAGDATATTRGATGRLGTPVSIPVTISADDPTSLRYAVDDPEHGSATIGAPSTPTGPATIIYTPGSGFSGTETFTWSATDDHGEVGTGTVTVTVTPNSPPTAPSLSASTRSSTTRTGIPASIPLTSADPDGDPITYGLGAVTGGTATLDLTSAVKKVVFTPAIGFVGTASVGYTARDDFGGVASGTITVTVTANTAPVGPDVSATVNSFTMGAAPVAQLNLSATDPDDDPADLRYVLLDQPTAAQGSAQLTGAALRFTPVRGYAGTVVLHYRVTDLAGDSDTANAIVVVNAKPVGTTSTASTVFGRPVVIPLTATDDGPQEDLRFTAGPAPAEHGELDYRNGVVTYSPDGSQGKYEPETDTFSYKVTDGRNLASDAKLVTVTTRPNTAPVADPVQRTTRGGTDGVAGIQVELPLHAVDAQGDGIVFSLDGQPSNGTAQLTASGTGISFTPDSGFVGTETITYRVTDRVVIGGAARPDLQATTTATANVIVTADAPPSAPLVQRTTLAPTGGPGAPVSLTLASEDPDAGDVPMFSLLPVDPTVGVATVQPQGVFTFTPARDFYGPAVVVYVATSPLGAAVTGVVVIDVQQNHAPTAVAATALARGGTTTLGRALPISLAGRISDPDGAGDRLTVTATAENGTVSVSGTTLTYRSRFGFSGVDTIRYQVSYGRGGTAQSTVTVTVARNRAPSVAAVTRRIPAGTRVAVTLVGTDPDGDAPLAYSIGTARKGTVSLTGSRMLFSSASDYAGPVTVRTYVRDALGATGSSTSSFTVYGASSVPRLVTVGGAVSTTPPKFVVTVSARVGSVAGGLLTLKAGSVLVGTGRVTSNGTVTITSRVKFAKGTHPVTASFGGTATTGTSAQTFGLKITR
ncbi:MAG: Ig-like domain-containing protein [Nakamurella sp.]